MGLAAGWLLCLLGWGVTRSDGGTLKCRSGAGFGEVSGWLRVGGLSWLTDAGLCKRLWLENRYQNGTLVSGNTDQYLRLAPPG